MPKLLPVLLAFLNVTFLCSKPAAQCSPEYGQAPAPAFFNTASSTAAQPQPTVVNDLRWQFAVGSINGTYNPAVVMVSTPPTYVKALSPDNRWISINPLGNHGGDKDFFFKIDFNLPCKNPCGKSFDSAGVFQAILDIYSDNSVYEIYVNGVKQSGNLTGIIPNADRYQADESSPGKGITVLLNKNWKAGPNSLVIQVSSSGPETGLLVQASAKVPVARIDTTVDATTCEGKPYMFGGQALQYAGTYYHSFTTPTGCDSVVKLNLSVITNTTTIDTAICEGSNYFGHVKTGTYTDSYTSSLGCDSTRTVHLTVYSNPRPHIEQDSILCSGDSLVISPGTFLSYLWQDGSTLDHYVVTQPGLYTVTVTSACGALKSAVYVNEVSCSYILFPSAFTPNRDGNNDYFKVLTHYTLGNFTLAVYNRFGQKVFETRDAAKGWDGYFNNMLQPQGTYVWLCSYTKGGQAYTNKGTVVLLR
ncbi:MAG TPA: gliding motility-associated C-terminal domain-containing protein [Chitinophagaceae bacterium]|nr:gliding motility-associated C-terminal domain-containing protein [Chitinophagaceae bacterium]